MKYGRIITIIALAGFIAALAAPSEAARSRSSRRPADPAKATPTPSEAKPALPPLNADEAKEDPKPEKAAKEGVSAATDSNSMFAGSNVKLKELRADDIEIDPNPTSGSTTMLGHVYIETDQFILKGETVRKNGQTIYATGSPVYIEMPNENGSTNKATAKRVTYNLETRRMRFEGDPIVNQIDSEKRTEIKADIIEYTQGKAEGGNISLKQLKNSNRQSTIKTYYHNESASKPKATPSARKVNSGNSGIINIPQPDIGG